MTDCIFCRVANAELQASLVCEDTRVIAFLDIHPINPGHTLVIPRRHVTSFTELSPTELEGLWRVAQRLVRALKSDLFGCEGVTLTLADGAAAGQEIFHAHLHVIPRHPNDQFGWKRFGTTTDWQQLKLTASQIRSALISPDDRNA